MLFRDIALMFVFLNVFNLLPLTPMDGGQMLETLFPAWARVIQTLFAVAVTMALGLFQVMSPTPFPIVLILFLWWRMFRIWREPGYIENEEGGRSIPTALQQLLFVLIWLIFMILPMISLMRIWTNRF
jgi:Zn-dependent protease